MSKDLLTDLQDRIAARLEEDAYFKGPVKIDVLTERTGNIENEINNRIGKIGLAVEVMTPALTAAGGRGGVEVELVVVIYESVTINAKKTGKPAPAVALAVLNSLALDQATGAWDGWCPAAHWSGLELVKLGQVQDPRRTESGVGSPNVYEVILRTSTTLGQTNEEQV
jgi:hypothetical protein